jgi:LETM1 and EF-hand domain-containing protein 1
MLDKVIGWAKKLTEAGVAVIALAVVVQIIFGGDAAFLPGDVTGSLISIISELGSANLVGLVAAGKMKAGTAEPVTNKDILKFSKLFEDEITLDNMTRGQLVAICRLLEFTPIGTNAFLRFQIEMQLRKLKADDVIIAKEGVEQMTVAELQTACKERGMRAVGLTKEKLVNQLKQWIELSTNEKVPSSLLLLSRTLFLPETVAPAQAIEASISSLPETVATGAKAKIGEREGKIDNVTRLEIIQQEQEKIELEAKEQERIKAEKEKKALEEKEKANRMAQAALEQAIEEQSVRMPPPAPPTAEGIVKEATSILRKATVSQEGALEDAGLGVAVTAHLADVMQESAPKKAVAKSGTAEELTTDDLSALREAIDALSQEKGQSFIGEHEVLSDIKQELVDYEEDLSDLKDVAESAGRKQLHQTKGAARLFKKVNRIMGRMDTVVAKLKTRESKLTENIDKLQKSEAHETLVTVQDLLGAVQGLQKVPDSSRLERISEVIASMDEDSDGIVKVEHVQKVIEILGRDNVQLSAKQVKQIIDLIGKEEMLEVENKIEKILGKMPAFEEELVVVTEAVNEQALKSEGGVEKDLTEAAGENVIEDMAVEMNEEKMEQHMAELFSRPDTKKEELKASATAETMTLENGQILSRPPRDTSVKDVTKKAAQDSFNVEEEVKCEKDQQQEEQELEKIPRKNGSSKH